MYETLAALIPGAALYAHAFGYGVLFNLSLAVAVALAVEAVALRCRALPIAFYLRDGSAILTAVLFALALPPYLAWWVTVLGVTVAVLLGKHLYGGLGNNVFNPAMVGYCFVLLAFPLEMTLWPPDGERFSVAYALDGILGALPTDAMTGQTPLAGWRSDGVAALPQAWHWAGFLVGGLWLLYRRIIAWRIPFAMLLAVLCVAISLGEAQLLWFHLTTGAVMLGAFFIATDPATSPKTAYGQLIFGAGIGVLLLAIRHWGVYIDGLAFAVLVANMLTPLLNRVGSRQ